MPAATGDHDVVFWLLGRPDDEGLEKAADAIAKAKKPVIVAGSVVANEEPLALIAFGTLQGEYRKALLVLAPRSGRTFIRS